MKTAVDPLCINGNDHALTPEFVRRLADELGIFYR